MPRKPRVVVVGPFPPTTGGVTTFMLNLLASSQKDDWRFVCHTTSRPVRKLPYKGQVSYRGFLQGGLGRALQGAAVTLGHALKYPFVLVGSGASVAQIQSSDYFAFWEASFYALITRLLGRAAVVRFGGAFDMFYERSSPRARALIRRSLQWSDAIVVQSKYWKDYFGRLTDPDKLSVITNGVPSPPPPPERAEKKGPVEALFICGTEPARKGIEELISAAPRLRGRVKVRCVATPAEVRERILASGLDDVLVPLDTMDRAALDDEYIRADIFLIPSHGEGFPNSLLEAMARALPAVATPVGAVPEILEEGVNGLLVPVGDADALAQATLRLADDSELRAKMGAANYRKVSEVYEIDRVCREFGRVWRNAMARRQGKA